MERLISELISMSEAVAFLERSMLAQAPTGHCQNSDSAYLLGLIGSRLEALAVELERHERAAEAPSSVLDAATMRRLDNVSF